MTMRYRAYDLTSGWYGPLRATDDEAEADRETRDADLRRVTMSSHTAVASRLVIICGEGDGIGRTERASYRNGEPVWGENRSNGAVRFLAPGEG